MSVRGLCRSSGHRLAFVTCHLSVQHPSSSISQSLFDLMPCAEVVVGCVALAHAQLYPSPQRLIHTTEQNRAPGPPRSLFLFLFPTLSLLITLMSTASYVRLPMCVCEAQTSSDSASEPASCNVVQPRRNLPSSMPAILGGTLQRPRCSSQTVICQARDLEQRPANTKPCTLSQVGR